MLTDRLIAERGREYEPSSINTGQLSHGSREPDGFFFRPAQVHA